MLLPRSLGLLGALLTVASCAGEVAPRSLLLPTKSALPAAPGEPAPLGPARYAYVDRLGSFFDEAGALPGLPGAEPALLDGVRVIVRAGIALDHARAAEKLQGFRALPERLGGGYVIWSDARSYRAKTFLGELEPITDTGAPGGVRPYLRTFLLRTAQGVLEVDPSTLAVHRFTAPGLAEAQALDARRAIQLDLLGRARISTDGGASFTDLLRERGASFTTLREGAPGELLLGGPSAGPVLRLGPEGSIEPLRDGTSKAPRQPADTPQSFPELAVFPSTRRSLPGEIVAHAVASGALLRGAASACAEPEALCAGTPLARLVVARERGLRVLSADTLLPLADADLLTVDEKLARCQPWSARLPLTGRARGFSAPVRERLLLACTADVGSAVLSVSDSLAHPQLQMTFPEAGSYVAGPHGRLGFTGRCGPQPPSSGDLGRSTIKPSQGDDEPQAAPSSLPEEPSPPDPPAPDLPPAGDARLCLRTGADQWVERRAQGPEIQRFYRWVPGEGARAIALLLGPKDASSEATTLSEGVTLVRIDPADPALQGGSFPALLTVQHAAPYRSIDEDFWQDDDGALRGWLRLPAEGEPPGPPAPSAQGAAARMLPIDPRRGGRFAGLRIDPSGKVEVFALPEGVLDVVRGGRFALAMSQKGGRTPTFESTDGGRSWAPVESPPTGRIEAPVDESAPYGCSPIGCALGGGVLRLGWGGRPPQPAAESAEPTFAPAANPLIRSPRPLPLRCHFDSFDEPLEGGARLHAPPMPSSRIPALAPKPPPRPRRGAAKGGKPPSSPGRDLPASPPRSISLHLDAATPIGSLHDPTWTGDVWLPFQPQASAKHLSVRERALVTNVGAVLPVLAASAAEPVDLLLQLGKRRLRVGEGRSFETVEPRSQLTVAADEPDGSLLLLDPDKGLLWLARGESQTTVLRLSRVPDVSRTRFTLARRLDGKGLSLVGYSVTTGEVFAGEIDLGRAEVGPLTALGRLETLAEPDAPACAGGALSLRFLAEVPAALALLGKGGRTLLDRELTGKVLIEASGERLCLRGVEAGLGRGSESELSARFGKGGGAALRREGTRIPGTCAVATGK